MAKRQSLSVVVPTKDRPEFLEGCLASLRRSLDPNDELIVADSASRNGSMRTLAKAAGARYVRCDMPGASRARNAGWRAARYEIVAFVDDDVRVDPSWASCVVEAFSRAPGIAFITGRIGLSPEQAGTDRPVAFMDVAEPFALDGTVGGTLGHSANLAVRRTALEMIGGFDESLGAGAPLCAAEDYDLFDRLFAAGLVGRYEPSASSIHDQWRTRGALLGLDWRYGVGLGARIAKLARSDRRRALAMASETFWDSGLRRLVKTLAEGWEFGALLSCAGMAGALMGLLRGFTRRVRDGHFVARRRGNNGTW